MLECIREYIQAHWKDIKEKTAGMNLWDKCIYVLAYYWYHILLTFLALGLAVFLIIHFAFGNKKPLFTCVMVNQEISFTRDTALIQEFSEKSGMPEKRVVFDSDYNISYGDVKLEGVNESSYEKFFFKWRNRELDAIILPESFYQFCTEMGGTYINPEEMDTGTLPLYEDEGAPVGILIEETEFSRQWLSNETGERLVLVFPTDGKHREACQKFLDFIREE